MNELSSGAGGAEHMAAFAWQLRRGAETLSARTLQGEAPTRFPCFSAIALRFTVTGCPRATTRAARC